jgi:hypothetical protein
VSEAPETQIIGVFHDRDAVEKAIETLQSHGLERGQLTILGTADAVRERLGLEVGAPGTANADAQAPVDKSEEQNMTPLLAGVPAYLGAVLAAGVTVASGGALAGAAVAALAGAAGGGALGGAAAGLFRGGVEGSYEEQLAKGGILLLVHPRKPEDVETAKSILGQHADRQIETEPDRSLT